MGFLRKIIQEEIKKAASVISEVDKYQTGRSDELLNAVTDKVRSSDELMSAADNLGINMDWSEDGENQFRKKNFRKNGTMKKGAMNDYNRKAKAAIKLLRMFTTKKPKDTALVPGGAVNFDLLRDELEANPRKYANMTFNEFMRVKDHLDLVGMRGTYDQTIRSDGGQRFGTDRVKKNDEFISVDNLDFNAISDKQVQQTRKLKKDAMQDPELVDEARESVRKSAANKFVSTQYGVKMSLPSVSMGNAKVKNAMIINFTSAFRCPAWNECLVKHACYARSGEQFHTNVKPANDQRNLMWLSASGDEKLMQMVHAYLMASLVSWSKVEKQLNKTADEEALQEIEEATGVSVQESGWETAVDELSKMWCHDLVKFPVVKKAIEDNLRVKDVRINENGDFINQNMLEEFDKYIAGEFTLFGVSCAAYSCRNLQFGRINNIIVNASRTAMKNFVSRDEVNKETGAIVRYFVAAPGEMYDAFEDTFSSKSVTADTIGSLGSLREPKPLYKVVTDSQGNETYGEIACYYYKCPCARKDFSGTNKVETEKLDNNTLRKKDAYTENGYAEDTKEDKGNHFKVNCYNCHMCYERPSGNDYKNMVVFVKAHGSEKNYIGNERETFIRKNIGVPKGYLEYRKKKQEEAEAKERERLEARKNKRKGVKESVEREPQYNNQLFNQMQEEGIMEVTNNAIMSMTDHFSQISGKRNEFNEMLKRINKPIKD